MIGIDRGQADHKRFFAPVSATELAQVWVIVPARNEAASIGLVLSDLPPVGRVIVVNNGSYDATAEVASDHGADVVNEPRIGYGSACLAGLARVTQLIATSAPPPPSIIVFLDADYSDHPEELIQLVEPILRDEADFVLGSRLAGRCEPGAMLPQALFGNRLACWLMRQCWGVHFSDLGPFRAIRYADLPRLNMQDANYGWTVEMQIKAAMAGLRIRELPVRYRRRIGSSKISGTVMGTIKAGYKILFTIARLRWQTWWNKWAA
jgi:glycosyltransferase involved in cell wall biosynthesis